LAKRRSKRGPPPAKPPQAELPELFEPYVWEWFAKAFGRPSPPQEAAWPRIAEGRSTLIFSPTGSGKTLAAFLWCINELFRLGVRDGLDDAVHVLYLSPLKALNNDIQRNLVRPLRGIRRRAARAGVGVPEIRSRVRTGDTTPSQRAEMARRPPHILITTPESLYIILATEKFRRCLKAVRYVIVDEIHAISDNKRGVHLSLSLERLRHWVGRDFVRIGLSATQKPLDQIARFLVGVGEDGRPRDCEIVDVGGRKDLDVRVVTPVDNLLEAHFDAIWGSAYEQMLSLIRGHDTTLIFTNSRYKTERTALRLNELSAGSDVTVGAHHGSMSKEVRLGMESRLKRGDLDALVATSSLELGIDVGSIDLVCQIETPKSVSRGLQRIGRAGHLLDATSEGRLLVTDRDDLVESAVLVRAVCDGRIDTTRIPHNCLDVLAQQIVGAVAADEWDADELYRLCRRSHCYHDLPRPQFDRTLEMLAGNYDFEMDQPPFPKLTWDQVNNRLLPDRASRLIAFRAGGTIPDIADYDVWFESKRTKVGQLDEGFVEDLRTGDIFILGSSSWRVLGIRRNRVLVEDVYGRAPTIPFWGGDRDSRTADLGALVGRFRREMARHLAAGDAAEWLVESFHVDDNGAASICEYFREQQLLAGDVPSDRLVMVEHFQDELGVRQIVIHSSFGIRVNETWALALCEAIERARGFRPASATVDDGILLTLPKGKRIALGPRRGRRKGSALLDLVGPGDVDELLGEALVRSPVFASRFRHNAVRSMLVLREYQGRRTPVWLQSLRASALLDACRERRDFPLIAETLRECLHEALDAPSLRRVLAGLHDGGIGVKVFEAAVPSPFTHTLLLLGQYGQTGAVPTRERRSRLMHLHRELLRQILDEETLRNLLDADAVDTVDARLQHTHPQRRARDANELARALGALGDLADVEGDEEGGLSLPARCAGEARQMLDALADGRRAVCVPVTTVETLRRRWIASESFPLYRAAFASRAKLDAADRKLLANLARKAPCPAAAVAKTKADQKRLDKLLSAYEAIRLGEGADARHVAAKTWLPAKILEREMPRDEARRELIARCLRRRGPVTKYEVMERYGFGDAFVEAALEALLEAGTIARGEYVPTKALPQWCHKANLREIHRLTLNRLRRETEPAKPVEYADFLIRWQHAHPSTRLSGVDGLREVIAQLEGTESYQALWEGSILPLRVGDYDPSMLDRLCYGGEVHWRRFDCRTLKRGRVGFCLRSDGGWIAPDPADSGADVRAWDDDIGAACDAVRRYLARHGACFFDDAVAETKLNWRIVLRAIWHLVWTGEATNDSYESIRRAGFYGGLSGCYDLGTRPTKKGVTIDLIVRHMLELRKLDPRLGRWAPTERLAPPEGGLPTPAERNERWAELLLKRYGIVCRDVLKGEPAAPRWKPIRRALAKQELLGKLRRGYFVQGLAGEQYALPEAVEAIRKAKLRSGNGDEGDGGGDGPEPAGADRPPGEPMILLNCHDPANPFRHLVPVTDEVGEQVKFVQTAYGAIVVQSGQPVLLYKRSIRLLADLSAERAAEAIRTLCAAGRVEVLNWNGHPIDISPARHLLTTLGFARGGRGQGLVHDGVRRPDEKALAASRPLVPESFERFGKEEAPAEYDAEWIVARSDERIRPKVRELIEMLQRVLPDSCRFVYYPGQFRVEYRGVRCINPYIQLKQIWVPVTHRGWVRGMLVTPETDLVGGGEFEKELLERFELTRRQIDGLLDGRRRRT